MGQLILGRGVAGAGDAAQNHDKPATAPDDRGADLSESEEGYEVH